MAKLKERPAMDKLKLRTVGFVPKQAANAVQRKQRQKSADGASGRTGPVRYAIDKVERAEKRAAAAMGSLAVRQAKAQFLKQRRKKNRSSSESPPPSPPSKEPSTGQRHTLPDTHSPTGSDHTMSVSHPIRQVQQFSTHSTVLSTTSSVDESANIQYSVNPVAERRQRQNFPTRDQASHQTLPTGADRPAPPMGHGETLAHSPTTGQRNASRRIAMGRTPASRQSGSTRLVQQKSDTGTPRFSKAAGGFRYGATTPKQAPTGRVGGRFLSKQVSPAQRAKAAAQQRAQKELAKQTARKTAQAAKKAGQVTARLAMAVGRAGAAAVQGLLAVCSSTVGLVVLVCLLLVAAIAASPFGIFFSGEGSTAGGVPLSVAVGQISFSFNQTLADLQSDERYDDVTVSGSAADWVEVVAVFAVKVAGSNETDATDVVTLDADRIDRLEAVFWDMTTISQNVREIEHPGTEDTEGWTESILDITITARSAGEMAEEYGFTEQQQQMLQELLADRAILQNLIGNLNQITADAKEVLVSMPEDITAEREAILRAACSLVGKVGYFWGGKSQVIGWDSRWGQLMKVTAAGSSTTGTYRPYGLDCSGFVSWVFYNATNGEPVMTGSAAMQHTYCSPISWSEAQPGDLVFYADDSHVGIVAGHDDTGNILIVHCTPSGGVVITGQEYFAAVGRPTFYGGA